MKLRCWGSADPFFLAFLLGILIFLKIGRHLKSNMRVLVVNKNLCPVTFISWRRAFTMLARESAERLKDYPDKSVRSGHRVHAIPAVLKIDHDDKTLRNVAPSHQNIFLRDDYCCAYCEKQMEIGSKEITVDHIKPICQGGKRRWENLITACRSCNEKKGSFSPKQAGMPLLFTPYVPKRSLIFSLKVAHDEDLSIWEKWLLDLNLKVVFERG